MYPIFMNISKRSCTVVGGGKVALRKIKSLLDNGAVVTVISPNIIPEITILPVTIILEEYNSNLLDGSFLVISATDDKDINRLIISDAREKQILVSSASNSLESDFILPATTACGNIKFAVSTGGEYPKLSVKICKQLNKDYALYGDICKILAKYRTQIITNIKDNDKKQLLLTSIVSDEFLKIAKQNGIEEYEKHIAKIINQGEK